MSIYRGRSPKELFLASSLYDCIEDNNLRAVKSVLDIQGTDPNLILPKKGISPFHLTIGNTSEDFALEVTRIILEHGGNPNIGSDEGLTPLHIAAAWERLEIVQLLLNSGADIHLTDDNGMTPFDYALESANQSIINIFQQLQSSELLQNTKLECTECYNLSLNKILINNGLAIGEYEVGEDVPESAETLKKLPRTIRDDTFILDWCCNHGAPTTQDNRLSPTDIRNCMQERDNIIHKKSFCALSTSDDSTLSNPHVLDFTHVNCTPRNNRNNHRKMRHIDSDSIMFCKRVADSFCKLKESSRESGIVTLLDSSIDLEITDADCDIKAGQCLEATHIDKNIVNAHEIKDSSSDYFTCNENGTSDNLEQNVFEISSDVLALNENLIKDTSMHHFDTILSNRMTNITCQVSNIHGSNEMDDVKDISFVSISEIYKYTDDNQGIVLYEKRLLVNPSDLDESIKSAIASQSSKLSSLPASFDYDTDTLKKELKRQGYNPGPITYTTKRVYLKKLYQLQKKGPVIEKDVIINTKKVYSLELEKTIRNPTWCSDVATYRALEEIVSNQFSSPDPSRKWREGVNKASFTYLLLDPRVTSNLPCRAEILSTEDVWQTFLSSVFYVGKGKRSRPYSHLYEAVTLWNQGIYTSSNKKLQHILDIWCGNFGVVCLHIFQNVIPVEAYTREAAMISALKIDNLCNLKCGDFYGIASAWPMRQKKMLGVYLLYKAMLIFLNEGERQLSPSDIN